MAASSEQQSYPFCFKRKFETEESSSYADFVYENGVVTPRSEKKQRLYDERPTSLHSHNSEQDQHTADIHPLHSLQPSFENQQNGEAHRDEFEESMDIESLSTEINTSVHVNSNGVFDSVNVTSRPELAEGIQQENKQLQQTNGVCLNLSGTRVNSCIPCHTPSYCYPGGLWDSLVEVYHGL